MYLARLPDKNSGSRYMIRQSYADGHCYRSRDLFDLGCDPGRFIRYPGGNGFYIDTAVEDALAEQGVSVSQQDLEPIFTPFLDPYIRRVIAGFDRGPRIGPPADRCPSVDDIHRFDRFRLHYLKLGQVDHRRMANTPDRFYARLACKSRDEIEYAFMAAEQILESGELAGYIYQIFDLQQFFNESFARSHPECLESERLDRFFIQCLCALNQDQTFWHGSDEEPGLRQHLVRYAVMFFDNGFSVRDPFRDFLWDFMNRHRVHRPPESVQVSLEDSARLFGVTVDALKKMDGRALARRYRQLALKHHPDQGGDPETFVKLSAAYHKVMKRKSRN